MPTVKLVVIGSSGVGKTSLRGKYISGRFSNGYRATIGADFITKVLPHPTQADQSVTLQIWDTAGQERFSSLSTAFFRGADAALLMFDVNNRETMLGLKKWWAEFCDQAPVSTEGDTHGYCCVVVGNKIDMIGKVGDSPVSESEALEFLDELVPAWSSEDNVTSGLPPLTSNGYPELHEENGHANGNMIPVTQGSVDQPALTSRNWLPFPPSSSTPRKPSPMRSPSIAIARALHAAPSPKHHLLSKSRSRSGSRFNLGTMTTTHSALSVYHTPTSSISDVFQSARASPEPSTHNLSSDPASPAGSVRQRRVSILSTGSASSGSAVTITPSLYARENSRANGGATPSASPLMHFSSPSLPSASGLGTPLPPERGPKLFFTSAKSGEGVTDVFEYIAQRVVRGWEYEEWMETRTAQANESRGGAAGGGPTIRLQSENWKKIMRTECCSS